MNQVNQLKQTTPEILTIAINRLAHLNASNIVNTMLITADNVACVEITPTTIGYCCALELDEADIKRLRRIPNKFNQYRKFSKKVNAILSSNYPHDKQMKAINKAHKEMMVVY